LVRLIRRRRSPSHESSAFRRPPVPTDTARVTTCQTISSTRWCDSRLKVGDEWRLVGLPLMGSVQLTPSVRSWSERPSKA
jgi:hypothetical protein